MKRFSTLYDDFKKLIENKGYFVDKSDLIKDFLEDKVDTVLITRPRRFGKTLNLSMIKYFLDINEHSSSLFNGLNILKDNSFCSSHMNQYPVITISFKDAEESNWENCFKNIKGLVSLAYMKFEEVIGSLREVDREYFNKIIRQDGDIVDYKKSLLNLTRFVEEHYGRKTILLIDEYDKPIQEAYLHNYYGDAVNFFRGFYSGALKGNQHLNKGLMTGILRVSKESIFSGLNNIEVHTVLDNTYSQYFGFSDREVSELLNKLNLEHFIVEAKKWYNGYKIGDSLLYNPWSIMKLVKSEQLKSHWINTSSNSLIFKTIKDSSASIKSKMADLIEGKDIIGKVTENYTFQTLGIQEDQTWWLMLSAGYLTISNIMPDGQYSLSLPNKELKEGMLSLFSSLFAISGVEHQYSEILTSLLEQNIQQFKSSFTNFAINSLSYFDVSGDEPEKFYHAFVLGILSGLNNQYNINSNREGGIGRFDVMLTPKNTNLRTIVIEFKKSTGNLKESAEDAIKQIQEKKYCTNSIKIGIAFQGKEVEVKYAE